MDPEGSLRPSIISAGKIWKKKSQIGLLGNAISRDFNVADQKLDRDACFDLLDALTKSGGTGIKDVELHAIVSLSHCFGKNLMSTLVEDNVNPIEKVEKSTFMVASQIFGKTVEEMKL